MRRIFIYGIEAFTTLWQNRTRSILTMLGMIIGTSSVIIVLGLGQAASHGIAASLNAFGDPGVQITVSPQTEDPDGAAIQYRDVATILSRNSDVIDYAYPNYVRNYGVEARGKHNILSVVSQTDRTRETLTMKHGRRIDALDVSNGTHVAVLTEGIEKRLFGDGADAVGEVIRINGTRFRIIGVYESTKASIFSAIGTSDYIEIGFPTFHDIAGSTIDSLVVYPHPGPSKDNFKGVVLATLRHLHGPTAQYRVEDDTTFLGGFEATIGVVSTGLTAIGAVAMLVAGIGIMNIMLVSVSERKREIGIRKAVGANSVDITIQFLMEAVVISLLGGGTGMLLGIGFVIVGYNVVSSLLGSAPVPWLLVVSVAVGFSLFVGIVFGTYPAFRAARMDPIEALRP